MQGQSSPVQVKDPYTGSILMHVGSSCKHTGVYNVHLPKNNQKLIDGSNRKTKKHFNIYHQDKLKALLISIYFGYLSFLSTQLS